MPGALPCPGLPLYDGLTGLGKSTAMARVRYRSVPATADLLPARKSIGSTGGSGNQHGHRPAPGHGV